MSFAEDAVVEVVFVAGTPSELDRAADVLMAAGIDFETEAQSFIRPFLGGSVCEGIGFFVLAGQAAFACLQLSSGGLERGVVHIDSPPPTVREFPIA